MSKLERKREKRWKEIAGQKIYKIVMLVMIYNNHYLFEMTAYGTYQLS